jgi:hypothetical protein
MSLCESCHERGTWAGQLHPDLDDPSMSKEKSCNASIAKRVTRCLKVERMLRGDRISADIDNKSASEKPRRLL